MFWRLSFLTLLCLVDARSLSTVTGQLEWNRFLFSCPIWTRCGSHIHQSMALGLWQHVSGSPSDAAPEVCWALEQQQGSKMRRSKARREIVMKYPHYPLYINLLESIPPASLSVPIRRFQRTPSSAFQIHFKLIVFVFSGELTWPPLSFLAVAFCCFTTFVFKEPWNFRTGGDPRKSFIPKA